MSFGEAEAIALVMLASLAIYSVTGGADFGGGVWDLLASGPRRADQRRLIERALAPVWEANHVWLIFIVILMFTAFPDAFSVLSIALYAPLSLVLVGVVLRGATFVFRQYGHMSERGRRVLGLTFGGASVMTPIGLGVILASLTTGEIRSQDGIPRALSAPWFSLFPTLVGAFGLALFAQVAAIYLAVEATSEPLKRDFRVRGIGAGLAVGALAFAVKWSAGDSSALFAASLLGSWWSWPLQIVTGAVALSVFAALVLRRDRLARALVIAQVGLIVLGFGLGQHPYLVAPDVTIASAAAPRVTLRILLGIAGAGALLLIPSLYALMRVFKAAR